MPSRFEATSAICINSPILPTSALPTITTAAPPPSADSISPSSRRRSRARPASRPPGRCTEPTPVATLSRHRWMRDAVHVKTMWRRSAGAVCVNRRIYCGSRPHFDNERSLQRRQTPLGILPETTRNRPMVSLSLSVRSWPCPMSVIAGVYNRTSCAWRRAYLTQLRLVQTRRYVVTRALGRLSGCHGA